MEPDRWEMRDERDGRWVEEATTATVHKRHKNYNQYPYPLALSYQRTRIIIAYICMDVWTAGGYGRRSRDTATDPQSVFMVHSPLSGQLYGQSTATG